MVYLGVLNWRVFFVHAGHDSSFKLLLIGIHSMSISMSLNVMGGISARFAQ